MGELDAMGATTRGLGEVILAALRSGATGLMVGLGGSASTDGGAGALAALGLTMLDEHGEPVPDGGRGLACIASIDRGSMATPPPGGVLLLTDVTAPLTGPLGAATVFGPQKGASGPQVAELDAALLHFADLLGGDPTAAGTGAAGGAAFGFASAWGAVIEPGSDYLAELAGLDAIDADVLLTGEGRFDDQSLTGKVVGRLLAISGSARVGIIAGQVTAQTEAWTASLTDLAGSVDAALAEPARWLRAAGAKAARELTA
jgi:glycerate kinase